MKLICVLWRKTLPPKDAYNHDFLPASVANRRDHLYHACIS
uniref:Uncharacterized protein n=1 Tax=Rhodnius prolixus TaxID=13249 RepID=T1I799_RHOPR